MRLIRAAGQNVSPSDDGRLYDQIFSDGLFTDTAFAALGTNNVQVGAMYGDLCGRDFTIEQQTIAVPLPEGAGETTGYIYVEIDTSAETPLSVGATLAPFTPTYEDINVNGAVAQMIVAEYTASAVAVTSVTATYTKASAGSVKAGSIATVESSPVTANHAIGEYILYGGTVYRVTAAIATGEAIAPGTNVIAESVGDALTSLNNGLLHLDKLWENPNPSASYSPQTVSLDLSGYDFVLVGAYFPPLTELPTAYTLCHIGGTGLIYLNVNSRHLRFFEASTTGVHFEVGQSSSSPSANVAPNNATAVPSVIYGVVL